MGYLLFGAGVQSQLTADSIIALAPLFEELLIRVSKTQNENIKHFCPFNSDLSRVKTIWCIGLASWMLSSERSIFTF